jgi:hypothetical protein
MHTKRLPLLMLLSSLWIMASSAFALEPQEESKHIDFSKETPSATVEITSKSIRLLAGGKWGSGTLHYQGKSYPFKVKGLSVGGIGYTSTVGVGEVYFLNKLEDFNGKYGAATIGATAVKGSGAGSVENNKGVIINLKAKSTGLALSLGASGISIQLEE